MEYNTGNISTIATWVAIIIMPHLIKYGISIDQTTLITFLTSFITILIAIWSSCNPNTFKFLGNNTVDDDEVLNKE